METKNLARLVQPIGGIATEHAPMRRAAGRVRAVRTRTTRLGTALGATTCFVALIVASIAPMASGSTSRRTEGTATNNVVSTQLGHLQETGAIAAGTMLGMENFLRDFPLTASNNTVSERATNNVVSAQLGHLQETGTIAAGTMLGMENFLRDFPLTASNNTVSERATNNVVSAQLGHLHETGTIAAGTMLGMENFLRVFPPGQS